MRNITVKHIIEITKGTLLAGDMNTEVLDICTDSRQIKAGDLFVPLLGEQTDGHNYIAIAMKTGAATLTGQDISEYEPGHSYIRVEDTEKALKAIGAYIRSFYPNKVIAITGSVGKTTTREMITAALSASTKVFHTIGNMNSQIGVPITLSHMLDEPSEIAVLEMGISEEGNMDVLAEIARPDIAVISTIGVAHIEYLKTEENIRKEKLKITSRMDENGVLFLNGDDPLLAEMKDKLNLSVYFFGTESWCDYRAENIRMENNMTLYDYCHGNIRIPVRLSMPGLHNVRNSLSAIAVTDHLGYDVPAAAEVFKTFIGTRQKITKSKKGYTIIDDTYNANPDSMKACINVLCDMQCSGKRIAVFADMLELGENSEKFHRAIGTYLRNTSVDELITIGEMAEKIGDEAGKNSGIKVLHCENNKSASDYINQILKPGDVITVKGSNSMNMSEIIESMER